MTYKDLIEHLDAVGVVETQDSLSAKLTRGTFSAAFMLSCLDALGITSFDVSLPEPVLKPRRDLRREVRRFGPK